jgi:hypothetical protein
MLIDDNMERIGKMRAEWDGLGHYCYAMAADWFQVATLLDKDELTVKSTSAELVPTVIKRMYDGERLLWGKAEPRTRHWSWLFHELHERLVELETASTFNIAGAGVLLAATVQLCRRADPNPNLVQLEHVLVAALELLGRYKAAVHGHAYAPNIIPGISREICTRLLTLYDKAVRLDGGTATANIKATRSLTMGLPRQRRAAGAAPAHQRRPLRGPAGRQRRAPPPGHLQVLRAHRHHAAPPRAQHGAHDRAVSGRVLGEGEPRRRQRLGVARVPGVREGKVAGVDGRGWAAEESADHVSQDAARASHGGLLDVGLGPAGQNPNTVGNAETVAFLRGEQKE